MTAPATSAPAPPRTVALVTLGCARNEVDSEELAGRLAADGWELVDDAADADAVVVNTCGFVEAAKKDSVDTLLAAADLKDAGRPQAVVAVGCLAERYGDQLAESLPEADAVLGFDDYADIGARLRAHRRRRAARAARPARPPAAAAGDPGRARRRRAWRCPATAQHDEPDLPEGVAPGERSPRRAPPARRRAERAAQAGLGLRPALRVLRHPVLPRLVRLAAPDRRARRGALAGRRRACASSCW